MSRLVIPTPASAPPIEGNLAKKATDQAADKYLDRLVKYIPAETVAFYTFTDKIVTGYYGIHSAGEATRGADGLFHYVPWFLILICLVGTPAYLKIQQSDNLPWRMQALISTVAFACWEYALHGSAFIISHLYNDLAAALAAPIFTFAAGAYKPTVTKGS